MTPDQLSDDWEEQGFNVNDMPHEIYRLRHLLEEVHDLCWSVWNDDVQEDRANAACILQDWAKSATWTRNVSS